MFNIKNLMLIITIFSIFSLLSHNPCGPENGITKNHRDNSRTEYSNRLCMCALTEEASDADPNNSSCGENGKRCVCLPY